MNDGGWGMVAVALLLFHFALPFALLLSRPLKRNARARLLRDNRVIYEGRIGDLRRFKEDAAEVRTGFDCGIRLENFQDYKPGDYIETYVSEEIAPTL